MGEIKSKENVELNKLINKFEEYKKDEKNNEASNMLIQALITYGDSSKVRNMAKKYFKNLYNKKLLAIEYFEH